MLEPGFYNMDCMEGMKQFPDKYFDLAIVDPPYGDARGGAADRFGERFDRYKYHTEGGVARKAEVQPQHIGSETRASGVTRTGGGWAKKLDLSKKSFRGMLPRSRNISMNCFASHGTK